MLNDGLIIFIAPRAEGIDRGQLGAYPRRVNAVAVIADHNMQPFRFALTVENDLDMDRHLVESLPRSDPGPDFKVCLAKLEREIGRRPVKSLYQIFDSMLTAVNEMQE